MAGLFFHDRSYREFHGGWAVVGRRYAFRSEIDVLTAAILQDGRCPVITIRAQLAQYAILLIASRWQEDGVAVGAGEEAATDFTALVVRNPFVGAMVDEFRSLSGGRCRPFGAKQVGHIRARIGWRVISAVVGLGSGAKVPRCPESAAWQTKVDHIRGGL